jgi:hypothetical protein
MTPFARSLGRLLADYKVELAPPLLETQVSKALATIGPVPDQLIELYHVTNGFSQNHFRVFPIESGNDIRNTWDSIQRANDPQHTKYLGANQELLEQYLVFADIGFGTCAAIKRRGGSIWYEEKGELHETNLNLLDFISTCFREGLFF